MNLFVIGLERRGTMETPYLLVELPSKRQARILLQHKEFAALQGTLPLLEGLPLKEREALDRERANAYRAGYEAGKRSRI